MTLIANNPYVGPRTFTRQEGNRFFGREREARDLFSLVVSERLTLFYAQSGAGKSSLINTRLIPQLQEAGFAVLPTGRVSGELPEGVSAVDNIFGFNLMLSLDQGEDDPRRFAQLSLTDFLAGLTSDDGEHYYYYEAEDEIYAEVPSVLIIDQFEEIITSHPTHWPEREGFFRQLDEAMAANSLLWVVLALREDFVAALDPYAPLLASKLRARFYMQRMGYEAALEAVEKPADQGGRPFAPGVAESMVDNLRQIRAQGEPLSTDDLSLTNPPEDLRGQRSHGEATHSVVSGHSLGQFIEPVQLQVVCYQLWENLKGRPAGEITAADLQELGNVDTALAEFYEQALQKTLAQTGLSEIDLRNWFDQKLITEAGTRGTVYQGANDTAGLPNQAVKLLADQFLLRAEIRSGGTWYELVHDRFVEPILQANQAWRLKQPLIQMAQAWANAGHSEALLLDGQQLTEALASSWQGLGPLVAQFLEAGQAAGKAKEEIRQAEKEAQRQRELETAHRLAEEAEARRRAEELRRQEMEARSREQAEAAIKLRQRAILLAIVGAIAVLLAIVAGVFGWQANQNAAIVQANATSVERARQSAVNSLNTATAERATVQTADTAVAQQQATALAATAARLENALATRNSAGDTAPDAQATRASVDALLVQVQSTRTAIAVRATQTVEAKRAAISGKLAFPVDNGSGRYDVFIYSVPDGQQLGKIEGARQPNFRGDGVKLLVNGQGGGTGENVLQANPNGSVDGAVSGAPQDSYPFYKPDGSTLTYSNPELAVGSDGNRHDYLFVQCSLTPPAQDNDKCQDMVEWNILVPAGQIGEIQGRNPVWTTSDRIVYSGCNTWAGGGSCGIFTVGSWATKRTSSGETPVKILDGASAFPTDTKAGLVAFQSRETGDWEAYVMAENGGAVVNISNSPNSNDGLPTISPDGQWVAFVSDREKPWAIFVAPISGGPAQKLFDLPKPNPWGRGDRDWITERMSWGK